MATITSAQTGNWSATSTWVGGVVPSDGDTATVATGHTVSITGATVIGTSGATGTIALTVAGTGVLNISSSLTLKGDLVQQRGTSIIGTTGGSIIFTPPSGSTYKWLNSNAGTGTATVNLSGVAGNPFILTTTQGGGDNAWWDGHSLWSHPLTMSNVTVSRFGNDNSVQAFRSDQVSVNLNWSNVLFNYCGQVGFTALGSTTDLILTNVDFRNSLVSATYPSRLMQILNTTDRVSGTRSITNLTLYNATGTQRAAMLGVRDATITNVVSYNISWEGIASSRTTVTNMFGTTDIGLASSIANIGGRASVVLENSVFLTHATNPHYIDEPSGAGGVLSPNIYQNNVFDGDGYWSSDAGDIYMPKSPSGTKMLKNIAINKAGTLASTMGASVATAVELVGNTMYGSYGAAICETSGGPLHIAKFQNNLTVNQPDGLHKQTSFVPQSNFTLSNNGYFNLINSDTYTWAPGDYAYMASMYGNRVGNTTCQAGTDTTHVVATGSPFGAVLAGDFVIAGSYAGRILTVTDANNLILDRPVTGLTNGSVIQIAYNWWDTAGQKYGDGTRGLGDINADPQFVDPTRTVRGYGSWASVQAAAREMCSINGFAYDGSAVAPTSKSVSGILAYIREGFTPTNAALATAGEGGTYIGAMAVYAHAVVNGVRRAFGFGSRSGGFFGF